MERWYRADLVSGFMQNETRQGFAILKDHLSDDTAWRLRRSDQSEFDHNEILWYNPTVDPSSYRNRHSSSFFHPAIMGLAYMAIGSIGYLVLESSAPIGLALGIEIAANHVLVLVLAFIYLIYVSFIYKASIEIDNSAAEKDRYVVPGWGSCFFTFGNQGMSVDGTHFVYFLEWGEVTEIVIDAHDRFIRLRGPQEDLLTMSRRFFEQNNGGDIGWQDAIDWIENRTGLTTTTR